MNDQTENKNTEKRSRSHPVIAVIGFFVILFLAAYLIHLFHTLWLIPVGIICAIAWAVFFAMEKDKKKHTENQTDSETEKITPGNDDKPEIEKTIPENLDKPEEEKS